ncbi:MAG: alpha/beta hydrolase, partial [Thiovulaceae bacterium]|nr:alpha/beta hydrolase [Sulfurimonadaceae bacterium]
MKRVLILYGWHGSDAPHWQEWLAKQLKDLDFEVSFPQLSDKMNPTKDVWVKEAKVVFDQLKPDIVVVHSLGNILWMHLCALGLVTTVSKLLLVAPPRDLSDVKEIKSFFPIPKTDNLCADKILMVASDNDPYMNLDEAKSFASQWKLPLKIVEKAGHINSDS